MENKIHHFFKWSQICSKLQLLRIKVYDAVLPLSNPNIHVNNNTVTFTKRNMFGNQNMFTSIK